MSLRFNVEQVDTTSCEKNTSSEIKKMSLGYLGLIYSDLGHLHVEN